MTFYDLTFSRQKELAIRVALGATGGDVVILAMRSAVVASVLGLVLGMVVSTTVTTVFARVFGLGLPTGLMLTSVALIVVIAVAMVAVRPAYNATRWNCVAALRSVPITDEQARALEAMTKATGQLQTEVVRTLIARALAPDPIEVTLLAELLFIRRVLLNGPTHAKAIDETKHRDAKLILAGKPLPYGAHE